MESGGIIRGARTAIGSFGGARILVTLLYEIRRRNLRLGLAALCTGGGQGIAMIVECWRSRAVGHARGFRGRSGLIEWQGGSWKSIASSL